MSSLVFSTAMHNIDRPNKFSSEIVNIAPVEGQIPVSFTSEPNCEALAFPKEYTILKSIYHFVSLVPVGTQSIKIVYFKIIQKNN